MISPLAYQSLCHGQNQQEWGKIVMFLCDPREDYNKRLTLRHLCDW